MSWTSAADLAQSMPTPPDERSGHPEQGAQSMLIVSLLLFACVVALVAWFGAVLVSPAGDGITTTVPTNAGAIVGRLPVQVAQIKQDLRTRRAVQAASPRDVATLTALAQGHVERARQSGDPREIGLAESALAPWWEEARPPVPVLLIRASIRQYLHDFDGALADLAHVIQADPTNLQAWMSQAAIQQTTGALAEAATSCRRLMSLSRSITGMVCLADLASLGGDRAALDRASAIVRSGTSSTAEQAWVMSVLAEMAERFGRHEQAETWFGLAAKAESGTYARVAFADWLLRRDRARDAVSMLASAPATDAVLLRRALAWRTLGDPQASAAIAELRERFESSQARGDSLHLREMARFALEIDQAPSVALDYASRNWALQKEPADALLLAAAARAAGSPDKADPVRRFVRDCGLYDVRLHELL